MTGIVTLLGAGPGDSELLTIKGVRRLKEADVLVYDRLVNQELFAYVSPQCERIDVGKRPGAPCIKQEAIEEILIEKAREGKKVVRLKSGDPYIFGRGGEEARTLVEAGISFEVVPGVTSAIAGATYAGIPMTYRDIATSFHVFTGHLQDEMESLNWQAISQLKGTLVFLMGMKNLSVIRGQLLENGFSKETPVAIVEWATHPIQRSIDGTLDSIVDLAEVEQLKAPSIIVVGDVVSFRKQLNFHENLPLTGVNVLIQESATGRLPKLLKDDGARLQTFPARGKIERLPFALPDLTKVTGLLVADTSSWHIFLDKLREEGIDIRQLSHLHFVAIGHHTAQAVEATGILLAAKAPQADDGQLRDYFSQQDGQWRMLLPSHKLEDLAGLYDFPALLTHEVDYDGPVLVDNWPRLDLVCLPNSVAAANFVAIVKDQDLPMYDMPIVVMGASTRAVLEKAGFQGIIETDAPTIVAIRDKCRQLMKRG